MVLEMEAPEYLDLDEIDFSDDSVVSVLQCPFSKRLSTTLLTETVLALAQSYLHLSLTLCSPPEVFCDIPEKHPRAVQEERWPG